jgi:hypothetical protein
MVSPSPNRYPRPQNSYQNQQTSTTHPTGHPPSHNAAQYHGADHLTKHHRPSNNTRLPLPGQLLQPIPTHDCVHRRSTARHNLQHLPNHTANHSRHATPCLMHSEPLPQHTPQTAHLTHTTTISKTNTNQTCTPYSTYSQTNASCRPLPATHGNTRNSCHTTHKHVYTGAIRIATDQLTTANSAINTQPATAVLSLLYAAPIVTPPCHHHAAPHEGSRPPPTNNPTVQQPLPYTPMALL